MLPLAVTSARATELGLDGLWGASALGYAAGSLATAIMLAKSDWPALAALARERSGGSDDEGDEGWRRGGERCRARLNWSI